MWGLLVIVRFRLRQDERKEAGNGQRSMAERAELFEGDPVLGRKLKGNALLAFGSTKLVQLNTHLKNRFLPPLDWIVFSTETESLPGRTVQISSGVLVTANA